MRFMVLSPRTVALAGILALASSGCATMFKAKTTDFQVTSASQGAQVSLNGQPAGRTPLSLKLSNKQNHVITIEQGGQQTICKVDSGAAGKWVVVTIEPSELHERDLAHTATFGSVLFRGSK